MNNAAGAAPGIAAGQSAQPPGDALTSQLPVKVYTGNNQAIRKMMGPPPRAALILTNTTKPGFFSSPGSMVGVRAFPLNPNTWNAQPATGAPSGGQAGGFPAKAKKKRSSRPRKVASKMEAVVMQQGRTGRQSTARTNRRKIPAVPRSTTRRRLNASSRSRPFVPTSLGSGTLVRLPKK